MEKQQTGGCLCGSLRYQACPQPDTAYYCHCRDCQIGSGSAFHVAVFADQNSFYLLSGEVGTYTKIADSGNEISRMFCKNCGTPVYWIGTNYPGIVILSVSSLDDPESMEPSSEIWMDSAVSWRRIHPELRSFSRN